MTSPGPWRVGRKVGRTIYDATDRLIGVMDSVEDARLIAAAPELLAALKGIVDQPPIYGMGSLEARDIRRESARALIARIEGAR